MNVEIVIDSQRAQGGPLYRVEQDGRQISRGYLTYEEARAIRDAVAAGEPSPERPTPQTPQRKAADTRQDNRFAARNARWAREFNARTIDQLESDIVAAQHQIERATARIAVLRREAQDG